MTTVAILTAPTPPTADEMRQRMESKRPGRQSKSDMMRSLVEGASESYVHEAFPQAAEAAETVLEGEFIHHLDPVEIDRNPYQNRRDFDQHGIDELAESIEANGQNQPIGVRRFRSRYQIIFGERRWRAIRQLPGVKIQVVIRDLNDREMIYICSSENSNRKKPYDYERWITIHQLIEMKEAQDEICKRLVLRKDQYYKLLKYGELHPDIRAFLEISPKALQINEAADLEKIFKDLKPEVDQDEVVEFTLKLMEAYVAGEFKNRGDIIKRIKAKYVDIKPRQREKVNTEVKLNMGDTVVGALVNTPTEFRVIISKEECDQEKIEKFQKMVEEFFKS
jgi:ParB family chromosome partitioning protein